MYETVERLSNPQIAVLALYAVGGATARHHTEDIAVKCFELAPSRFSWHKYPQYPKQDTARVALTDARKAKNGQLVAGSERTNWILTPDGVSWCEEYLATEPSDTPAAGANKLRLSDHRSLQMLTEHPQYDRWLNGEDPPESAAAADTVGLLPDAPPNAVARRIQDMTTAARTAGFREVERFLAWLTKP